MAFKARCCSAEGITANLEVRLSAYEEVASKVVTENILSQHMHKTMIDPKMTWIVKKQFAQSAAMSGGCFLGGAGRGVFCVGKGRRVHQTRAAWHSCGLDSEILASCCSLSPCQHLASRQSAHQLSQP